MARKIIQILRESIEATEMLYDAGSITIAERDKIVKRLEDKLKIAMATIKAKQCENCCHKSVCKFAEKEPVNGDCRHFTDKIKS